MKTTNRILAAGFTLVELLVALTIASVLTVIALPSLKDSLRANSLSRSASVVKGALLNARAQAIRTGRPFGLVFERQRRAINPQTSATAAPVAASDLALFSSNYCSRMYYVQSAFEYRGDTNEAVCFPVFRREAIANTMPVRQHDTPALFFPENTCGTLAAAANNTASPARSFLNIGVEFSLGESSYVFTVTDLTYVSNTSIFGETGTVVDFDFAVASSIHGLEPWQCDSFPDTGATSFPTFPHPSAVYPGGLPHRQPFRFKFRTLPIRAPLAPVSMMGRTVIDLSVSGTADRPLMFSAQEIIDLDPSTTVPVTSPNVQLPDVLVMFAPDGQLNGVYTASATIVGSGPSTLTGFQLLQFSPATTLSFNIGFVDGVLGNIDDGARYPSGIANTDFQYNVGDVILDSPYDTSPPTAVVASPVALEVSKVPNFANPECAWVSVQPLSGAIRLDTVASQPNPARLPAFINYYGLATSPSVPSVTARNVIRARVRHSRRLASSGAIQ